MYGDPMDNIISYPFEEYDWIYSYTLSFNCVPFH